MQKALRSRHRHELSDTLRPLTGTRYRPNGVRPKAAFLPNDSSKELERQVVCGRRGFDHLANGQRVGCCGGTIVRRRRFLADAWRQRCRGCGAIITLTRAVRLGELCVGGGRVSFFALSVGTLVVGRFA